MPQYSFDFIVFICRVQPPHIGHIKVIQQALQLGKTVIVVLGSADQPRTPKNPFSVIERAAWLTDRRMKDYYDVDRIKVTWVRDSAYNDSKWTNDVQEAVEDTTRGAWTDFPPKIGLIGHKKDESSFYLDLFPQWDLIPHEMNEVLSATDLRELYFEQKNLKFLQSVVPGYVYERLEKFRELDDYKRLVYEYNFLQDYKKKWGKGPFVTTDAVVVQSGHILLIQRKADAYGGNLWALPGGFLEDGEWIMDGMLRELREETKLKVPAPVLKGSIKNREVFDAPNRSQRGRVITHAFHIELAAGPLPKVKGSDDAQDAAWWKISSINSHWEELFEDHGDIISYFVGV